MPSDSTKKPAGFLDKVGSMGRALADAIDKADTGKRDEKAELAFTAFYEKLTADKPSVRTGNSDQEIVLTPDNFKKAMRKAFLSGRRSH